MGGTESKVEGFYSLRDTQKKTGGQRPALLEARRSLIDWAAPNIMNAGNLMKRAARLYISGSKDKKLKRHNIIYLKKSDENSYKQCPILRSMKGSKGLYPWLCDFKN